MSRQEKLGCTPDDIELALKEAADLAKARGGIMTAHRTKALRLLLAAKAPIRPYRLMKDLKEEGPAKPPTVYRTLDALIEMGLIHRIECLGAYTPCRHWTHAHSPGFLICNACGRVDEIDIDNVHNTLAAESASVEFTVRSAAVEVNGACHRCS